MRSPNGRAVAVPDVLSRFRRAALSLGVLSLGACASPSSRPPVALTPKTVSASAKTRAVTWAQSLPEEAFWVEHTATLDRVLSNGSRMELSPEGLVRKSAWEIELAKGGEQIVGGLAVAPHLGSGFVHWTRSRLFFSKEFTGPLEPIELAVPGGNTQVRGARNGPSSVLVVTDAGPRQLTPGQRRLARLSEPGVYDLASIDGKRAVRLDVFGRASMSNDGGKTYKELSPSAGIAVRGLYVATDEVGLETWQGRLLLDFNAGSAVPPDTYVQQSYNRYDQGRMFGTVWKNTRATDRDDWPGGWRDSTPLMAAVNAGVDLGDGTALGISQTSLMRVDVATGKRLAIALDWFPQGFECQVHKVDDGVTYACSTDRYQSYGSVVLHAKGGEPPVVERVFTDDGSFVGDDSGALAFLGSCAATARVIDYDQMQSRYEALQRPEVEPIVCVRRGPGDWVERTIDVPPGSQLFTWVPKKDGTVVALLVANEALPEPSPRLSLSGASVRVSDRGGVRVVRVPKEAEGWSLSRSSYQPNGRGFQSLIDKRYRDRDGAIDVWLSGSSDIYSYSPFTSGGTIGPDGVVEVRALPPDAQQMTVSGDFGLAITSKGQLYETTDHGRHWSAAGDSPVSGAGLIGACSRIGCVLGGVVRTGWGSTATPAIIGDKPLPPPETPPPLPRLFCTPTRPLEPIAAPPDAQAQQGTQPNKIIVSTGYGDTLEIVRDASVPEPTPPPGSYPGPGYPMAPPMLAPTASASAGPAVKKAPAAPVLRTHTLVFRPPLDPKAKIVRLNATDAQLSIQRRNYATPILAANGASVALLVQGDTSELFVTPEKITTLPSYERRYYYGDAMTGGGLALPNGHSLLFGDVRRRLTIEEHGGAQSPPPMLLGVDRDGLRRRPLTLVRRDDGTLGVVVLDGLGADGAGVVAFDRTTLALGASKPLASWSQVVAADDPKCSAREGAWRGLLLVDPSAFFELDSASLPGISLARQGLALVRWTPERVCLEAIDLAVGDARGRGSPQPGRNASLVARFDGSKGDGNAALRGPAFREDLACSLKPVVAEKRP
jgi:hypothetical protein